MKQNKLKYVFVIIFAGILIMPIIWMVAGSFQTRDALLRMPPRIITEGMGIFNYVEMLKYPIFKWTLNSIIVSVCASVGSCVLNLMAGYAFAKMKFKGKEIIFTIFLVTMLTPGQITLIPSFLIIKNLGLYNSLLAVILPGMSAFSVFLCRQYIEKIPDEFFAMAKIDGANEAQKFFRILIPLAAPVIATILVMNFIGNWKNFLWPMIVLSDEKLHTLPMGVARVLHQQVAFREDGIPGYGVMMATAAYSFIPMLIVFITAQRFYLKGLFGNIKG